MAVPRRCSIPISASKKTSLPWAGCGTVAKTSLFCCGGKCRGTVRIVGCDRHPEWQNNAFAAETVRPNIQLDPEQDERQIVQTLARAGIYAATSQYEPFGLAPVEAALSRCAIVASDIPSFRELWDGAAIFFRNNDEESLCAALERLRSSAGLRREQGNIAYRHARQHFSAERMVAGYKNLYHSLVPAQALSA